MSDITANIIQTTIEVPFQESHIEVTISNGLTINNGGGSGHGDVTGPASSIADNFASFLDTSGTLIKDSGYGPANLLFQGANLLTEDLLFDGAFGIEFGSNTPITNFGITGDGLTVTNTTSVSLNVISGINSAGIQISPTSVAWATGAAASTMNATISSQFFNGQGLLVNNSGIGLLNAGLIPRIFITTAGVIQLTPSAGAPTVGYVWTATNVDGSGSWQAASGGISGLTATRVPFAASATTLDDDAAFTWDDTNKALTVNSARIISNGSNGIKGFYFGFSAGNFTSLSTSDGQNTGIGYQALSALINGANIWESSYNTAIGFQASKSLTTGFYSTSVGWKALTLDTTSPHQTAVGYKALSSAVAGLGNNTAVGSLAAWQLTTGYDNVNVGYSAGLAITTGFKNTTLGNGGGSGINTGAYNTILGSEAGELVAAGQSNVMVGYISGVYTTSSWNTLVGTNSGGYSLGVDHALTSGGGNTFIGANAGLATTTQVDGSSAIGYNSSVATSFAMVFGGAHSFSSGTYRTNYSFGGLGASAEFGGGRGMLFVYDRTTVPSSAPVGGAMMYSQSGVMKIWNAGAGSPFIIGAGGALWGALTGTITDQTDLVTYVAAQITAASLPSFDTTHDGYVLQSGSATKILLGDGTWVTNLPTGTTITAPSVLDNSTKIISSSYVDGATGKLDKLIVANRQTASYTLVLADGTSAKLVEMNVASANNLTVPTNASVAFPTGTQIMIAQYGAGQTTILAAGGVTLRSDGAKLKINAQYGTAGIVKISSDEWYVFGDLSA